GEAEHAGLAHPDQHEDGGEDAVDAEAEQEPARAEHFGHLEPSDGADLLTEAHATEGGVADGGIPESGVTEGSHATSPPPRGGSGPASPRTRSLRDARRAPQPGR